MSHLLSRLPLDLYTVEIPGNLLVYQLIFLCKPVNFA